MIIAKVFGLITLVLFPIQLVLYRVNGNDIVDRRIAADGISQLLLLLFISVGENDPHPRFVSILLQI